MNQRVKRFAVGFVVAVVAAGLANLLPYLLTHGAYNGDGYEVVGFPVTFRRLGGIAGVQEFSVLGLVADTVMALVVAVVAGFWLSQREARGLRRMG